MNTCPKCGTRFTASQRLCPHDGSVLEPDQPSELKQVGKVLDSKYRLESYLSRGGMGAVYKGTHVMLGRPVAVKLINPDLLTSPDIVRRFQREARAVTQLNHPNIVEVYDLGQTEDGTLYIAMELVSGQSLSAMIKASGPLSPARIVSIMGQVTSALAHAHHNNIVHRDLKPHNIMVTQDRNGHEVAKLLDFGIAKTFEIDAGTQLTSTGTTLGTPQYMSPEQATGAEVDARSDLYSLGIILYEMLIGEVPFSDPSTPAVLVKHMTEAPTPPSRRRPDLRVSPGLEAIALRCLEKDPANRFQSAEELGAELARVPVEPIQAIDDGATIPLRPPVPPLTQSAKPTVLAATVPSTAPATAAATQASAASDAATVRSATSQPTAAPPVNVVPPPLPPPLPPPPAAPGTRPTVAAAIPPPAVQPAVARSRSMLVPVAVIILLIAILGGGYWAMMRSRTSVSESVTASQAPPATPAMAEPAKPEPAPSPTAAVTSPTTTPPAAAPTAPRTAVPSSTPPRSTTTAAAPPREAPAAAKVDAVPATPTVSFKCTGPGEVCAPLKSAIEEIADREGMVITRGAKPADVALTAEVGIVDRRPQSTFGTTLVITTYSIDLSGESARFDQSVPMPPSRTFSADASVGRERLAENARVAAADAIERVQTFWKKHLP